MPDLHFAVDGIQAFANAAVPTLGVRLRVTNVQGDAVQHVALQTQIQIEPVFRSYTAEEQVRLRDLFDDPSRWGDTLKPLFWTRVDIVIPAFEEATTIELPVPCSFDFNIAATKYFGGVQRGEIPLRLLFSGTVFYRSPAGGLQIARIPWDREAECRLPVDEWQRMRDLYYPNEAWLPLRRDVFERLHAYKTRGAFPTWDDAVVAMLEAKA
ncbi:MAG TPA: DUF6084 family protein [Thermoanaerobaculia bacterium]|nr:DUF6084 family protein [Thermoanaerobaculia bacterium]